MATNAYRLLPPSGPVSYMKQLQQFYERIEIQIAHKSADQHAWRVTCQYSENI